MLKQNFLFCLILLCFISVFSVAAKAQDYSFNYLYSFGSGPADEPPKISGANVNYPETAMRNGVEGTVKASVILGEDGKTRDIKILQGLPFGVDEAVIKGLQNMYFEPAKLKGQPVAVEMILNFIVIAIYDESDKNVTKPQILEKPDPVYPSKYLEKKLKGKVTVSILFFTDGKLKIFGVSSTLPREFDSAATEAAEKIRFQSAVHKKSKANVTQKITVEYDFKP